MDWTEVLAEEVENRRARLVTEILASPAYDSTAARVEGLRPARGRVPGDVFQLPEAAAGRPGGEARLTLGRCWNVSSKSRF